MAQSTYRITVTEPVYDYTEYRWVPGPVRAYDYATEAEMMTALHTEQGLSPRDTRDRNRYELQAWVWTWGRLDHDQVREPLTSGAWAGAEARGDTAAMEAMISEAHAEAVDEDDTRNMIAVPTMTPVATYRAGWYSGTESTWGTGDRDAGATADWHLTRLRQEWPEDTFQLVREDRAQGADWSIWRVA